MEKESNDIVNRVHEINKLWKEGKEINNDLISNFALKIDAAKDIDELKTLLKEIEKPLQKLKDNILHNTKYTVEDLKKSTSHGGENPSNPIKEINEYDTVYTFYLALEKIIKEKEKQINDAKLKVQNTQQNNQRKKESADYGHIVKLIAREFADNYDKYSSSGIAGNGKPNKEAYVLAAEYVKQMSRPTKNFSIDPNDKAVVKGVLPFIGPHLIVNYFDKQFLIDNNLITPKLEQQVNQRYSKLGNTPTGFTLNHDKILEHLNSKDSDKGFLKAMWDD